MGPVEGLTRAFDSTLREIEGQLSLQLNRREKLLKESRDVISAGSRAIINVHNRKMSEASKEIEHARNLLSELRKEGEGSLSRYLVSPESEFVEASAVYALVSGKQIPRRKSLGASPDAYLLGLLDTVGELKRLTLDSIMNGDMKRARRYFEEMESLYSACSPLAVYDHVANGARRKIDVARMLVEDTRGVIAEEMRRESVNVAMDRLRKKLDGRRA